MKCFDLEDLSIKNRIVFQNQFAFSFVNKMPIVPGHAIVTPIRVVSSCEELSMEEWRAILELKNLLCIAMKKAFSAEGFNFAWNEGECAGQTVPHFHLHVLPRRKDDAGIYQYEPRSFLYRPGTRAQSPAEELHEVAKLLQSCGEQNTLG
jgi:diadenosine tetraphosphate (Ap4A) HIT family hydrolase